MYSLHQFVPLPPKNDIDCDLYSNASSPELDNYLRNRSVFGANSSRRSLFLNSKTTLFPDGFTEKNYIFINLQDYDFVEEVLTMMYSPTHFFCFAVDSTADDIFRQRMRKLGDCLVNILVPKVEFDTSTSHGLIKAHQSCFEELKDYEWKHALVNAENDMPLFSTKFFARRARRLRDLTDINGVILKPDTILSANPNDTKSELYKTAKTFLKRLGSTATLNKQTQAALYQYLSNLPDFQLKNSTKMRIEADCKSKNYDADGSCIYGMEDFATMRNSPKLFVRGDPHFDFGFVQCLHEVVFQRTFYEPNVNDVFKLVGEHYSEDAH
ncbi:unnamed protein product [Caenorhabditis auriculariae]|uniref:Uncharacterized protein n=1 Tax=Caenorhabditis auriculariae TaxID=2777116 RepID=A0A8S1H5E2_9PELO|nr:unnamed protein product [Caenorhabditis auriculariae]